MKTAIRKREVFIPEFLDILRETAENISQKANEDSYFAHIYAMLLLAQFREKKAYPIIIDLVSNPQDEVEPLLGDVITELLDSILASVCQGDIELICKLIENENCYDFVRGAGLGALNTLVAEGIKSREEIIEYYKELFRNKLEKKSAYIWDDLITSSCDLYPEELMDDIRQAFNQGFVDESMRNMEDVHITLNKGKEEVLRELKEEKWYYNLIDDIIEELENWSCFQEER